MKLVSFQSNNFRLVGTYEWSQIRITVALDMLLNGIPIVPTLSAVEIVAGDVGTMMVSWAPFLDRETRCEVYSDGGETVKPLFLVEGDHSKRVCVCERIMTRCKAGR
jgi:hypothetical protein